MTPLRTWTWHASHASLHIIVTTSFALFTPCARSFAAFWDECQTLHSIHYVCKPSRYRLSSAERRYPEINWGPPGASSFITSNDSLRASQRSMPLEARSYSRHTLLAPCWGFAMAVPQRCHPKETCSLPANHQPHLLIRLRGLAASRDEAHQQS